MKETAAFLKNLNALMSEQNLSFETLGARVSINPRSIRRWYEGKAPKLESMIKIADYFDCSIDFLLGLTDDEERMKSHVLSDFISRYQSLLKEKGFNDYRVSKLCGIGSGTIAKWRQGRTPDLPILIKLCEIFDCGFEYLIGRSDF